MIKRLVSIFKGKSLSTTYLICASFVTFILILFCLAIGWALDSHIKNSGLVRVKKEGHRIEKEIINLFQETEKLMVYVGKEIVKNKPDDLLMIWKQLRETLSSTEKFKSFNWPDFGWIDSNNKQLFNTKEGLMAIPADMSIREYIELGPRKPWTLQFATPGPSIPVHTNGAFILPIGIGVTDKNGQYLGIVSSGFHLPELNKKIDQIIKNRSVDYVLLDQHSRVILQTLGKMLKWDEKRELPIISHTTQIKETPFRIITFLDEMALKNEYYQHFIPHLIKLLGIGFCCLLLIYIFLKNILKKNQELEQTKKQLEQALNLAQSSDLAKEEFLRRIKKELMVPFISIVTHADILLKHSKNEINLALSSEKKIEFLKRMKESAINLQTLTTNVLDQSYTNVKAILEDCLKIHSKQAFMKGISLHSEIAELPNWYVDELRFKQIILGILSRSMRFSRKGETVFLSAITFTEHDRLNLKIIFKNNGHGLSDEEWENVTQKYSSDYPISRYTDGTDLPLPAIERLIHLHHGSCSIDPNWKAGTVITLIFPFRCKEESEKSTQDIELEKSSIFLCDWRSS